MSWFGGQFFFEGSERWQLWFDNPNKAAVFLAEISIVGIVFLATGKRCKYVLGLILFLLSSLALLYTFSRGGLIAWAMSSGFLLWRYVRERDWSFRGFSILSVMVLVAMVSIHIGFSRRIMHGLTCSDKSVCNRIEVWTASLRMLWDAPWGWGLSNSGKAYVDWYQPLNRDERYRTLVNSHLTWAVETGWLGAFAWVLMWCVLLGGMYKIGTNNGRWICFAEWLCLFIAGIGSSVMECPWLWCIPMVAIVWEVLKYHWTGLKCLVGFSAAGFALSILIIATLFIIAWLSGRESLVSKRGRIVSFKGSDALCWLVADEETLGGTHFPHVLRACRLGAEIVSFNIVDDVSLIPAGADTIVFCGQAPTKGRRGMKQTIWLSPSCRKEIRAGDLVIVGEFAIYEDVRHKGERVVIPGVSFFIPNWPIVVSKSVKEKQCATL